MSVPNPAVPPPPDDVATWFSSFDDATLIDLRDTVVAELERRAIRKAAQVGMRS